MVQKKSLDEGLKNEAKAALGKWGPELYSFITKGGKVDTSKQNGNKKVFSNFQLQTCYKETELMETEVQKLLEARKKADTAAKSAQPIKPKRKYTKHKKPGKVKKQKPTAPEAATPATAVPPTLPEASKTEVPPTTPAHPNPKLDGKP